MLAENRKDRSNGCGKRGENEAVLVRSVGAKRKKRGIFLYGEVRFLLTCPLMGDPEIVQEKIWTTN